MTFLSSKKPLFKEKTSLTTKRRSILTKSRLERYLELLAIIMGLITRLKICKCFDYSKISFLWSKKLRFEKIRSSNNNTKMPVLEKCRLERYLELLTRNMG